MSFNCYVHNWSSGEVHCPSCLERLAKKLPAAYAHVSLQADDQSYNPSKLSHEPREGWVYQGDLEPTPDETNVTNWIHVREVLALSVDKELKAKALKFYQSIDSLFDDPIVRIEKAYIAGYREREKESNGSIQGERIYDLQAKLKSTEQKLEDAKEVIKQVLYEERCNETSCPYPCRAMCSNPMHKLLWEYLKRLEEK